MPTRASARPSEWGRRGIALGIEVAHRQAHVGRETVALEREGPVAELQAPPGDRQRAAILRWQWRRGLGHRADTHHHRLLEGDAVASRLAREERLEWGETLRIQRRDVVCCSVAAVGGERVQHHPQRGLPGRDQRACLPLAERDHGQHDQEQGDAQAAQRAGLP